MRLRVLIGWAVFFFLLTIIAHVMPSPRGMFYFIKGKQRVSASDFEGAARAFEQSVNSDPQFVRGYVELGSTLTALNKHREAEAAFKEAVALEANACAYCGLGISLRAQKRNDEAEVVLKKAIDIDRRDVCAFDQLGRLYYDSKNYRKAAENFTRVVALKPNASAYHFLANSLYRSGDIEKSIEQYLAATGLSPSNASIFIDLARAYHQVGREHEAMNALNRAVEIEPGNEQARSFLAVTHFVLGNERAATEQYEWIRAKNPELAAELWRGFEKLSAEKARLKKLVDR